MTEVVSDGPVEVYRVLHPSKFVWFQGALPTPEPYEAIVVYDGPNSSMLMEVVNVMLMFAEELPDEGMVWIHQDIISDEIHEADAYGPGRRFASVEFWAYAERPVPFDGAEKVVIP
jgi:hypothetical protein